ncbi:hypothetical protein HU147_18685 [Planomicrobium chinense]|uniref:hypothetical protein n=1 Tax=Planococcus chinensis TaxID=272917 RepID=UPI001CC53D45|nr:hypothetical protein [Planococcus chinensis]MBZ5203234.1 hypothetical protein [Planococcus chinensis]
MVFLKVNELGGGPIIVNMAKVEQITRESGDIAKLWFSVDAEDVLETEERFDEVESMLQVALTGYPGVVSVKQMEMVVR